jgi:hypothetical protein
MFRDFQGEFVKRWEHTTDCAVVKAGYGRPCGTAGLYPETSAPSPAVPATQGAALTKGWIAVPRESLFIAINDEAGVKEREELRDLLAAAPKQGEDSALGEGVGLDEVVGVARTFATKLHPGLPDRPSIPACREMVFNLADRLEAATQRADAAQDKLGWMIAHLAECYRQSGADPDGNEDWRIAPFAMREVKRMRAEYDAEAERADAAEYCGKISAGLLATPARCRAGISPRLSAPKVEGSRSTAPNHQAA